MKRLAGLAFGILVMLLPGATALGTDVGLSEGVLGAGSEGASLVAVKARADHDSSTNVSGPSREAPDLFAPAVDSHGMATPGHLLVPEAARNAAGVAVGAAIGLGLIALFWNSIKTWALGTALLPFFSRIDGNRILDNDVRNKVHEAILQNPGITIKEITKVLGIGWGTAIYHLKRLESERLIVSERHRQFRRFFKNGGGIANESKTGFAELKNATTHRLATAVLERPGSAQKELCEALGISAPIAHKYLGRLEDANLLTKQREWKTVKYFPTGKLSELVRATPTAAMVAVVA